MPVGLVQSPTSIHEKLGSGENVRRLVSESGPFGVNDTLRNGLHSTAHDLAPRHPLQTRLSTLSEDDDKRKMILGAQLLGQHIPIRLCIEKAIIGGCQRLHGLPSSNLGMSILNGTDDTIDTCEFLNVPSMSPDMPLPN